MSVQGRVALVSGAAQGIGRAIAVRLAAAGAFVALLDRDGEGVEAAAAELKGATAWVCDVRDSQEVRATVKRIFRACGPIDLLINNAGIWRHTPVLQVDEARWDEVFAVNVKGILFCSQAVAGGMVWRGAGKIVNIASVAGFGGSADWSAYCASKAAAISLSLGLARELEEQNVQVNVICPGATQTALLESIRREEPGAGFDWVHEPREVAREVIKLVVPFDQAVTGRVVAMKPAGEVLGINVAEQG